MILFKTRCEGFFFFFFSIHLIPLGRSPMLEFTYVNCLHNDLSGTRGSTVPKGWMDVKACKHNAS